MGNYYSGMREFLDREFLSNPVESYLYFAGAFAVFYALGRFSSGIVKHILRRLVKVTESRYDDVIVEAMRGPLMAAMVLVGIRVGAAAFRTGTGLHTLLAKGVAVAGVIIVAWFGVRLWNSFVERFLVPLGQREGARLDPQLIPVIRRAVAGGIWVFTFILAASEMGYNIVSLLTGLGIGGLAVALAAKDTLSPMVGGIAIFMTKPFQVGHYIVVGDKEGTVEEVGLRATTIRTRGGSALIIPNDQVINAAILNRHRAGASKVSIRVGVPYDLSADEIERVCEEIRGVVRGLPAVDVERGGAKVETFGDSAIILKVNYWVTDPKRHSEAAHALHVGIKRRFDELGVEFPYPTRTHVVHQAPRAEKRRVLTAPPASQGRSSKPPALPHGPPPSLFGSGPPRPSAAAGSIAMAPTQHVAPSTVPPAAAPAPAPLPPPPGGTDKG